MGPTASGKTGVALDLVKKFPFEIISVDSALVYRDMNIGTAKPDAATLARAPHHLIDIIPPSESYSAARFREDALLKIAEIIQRKKNPLLVGGTMLYFKALQQGLSELPVADEEIRQEIEKIAAQKGWPHLHQELAKVDAETANRLNPNDSQRIQRALEIYYVSGTPMSELINQKPESSFPYRAIKIALLPSDRSVLHERIAVRFKQMLERGFVDEVIALRKKYSLNPDLPSMRCVGYRQVWQYLEKEFDEKSLLEKGIAATRQLAKRQLTWLRAMDDLKTFDCLDSDLSRDIEGFLAQHL
jgi:tRNA dimethylallyltransferase